MNVDGTDQRRLTAGSLEAFYPDWAPDGAHIIFTDNCCIPHSNVWVMKPDGSGLKQLTNMPQDHGAGFASYSPDGKKIVLQSDLKSKCFCTGDLYTMDANGTHLTRIVSDQPAVFLSDWGSAL
jgi:Tol biopolymer transport system component